MTWRRREGGEHPSLPVETVVRRGRAPREMPAHAALARTADPLGDSARTRERLLLAGYREFASKGLAGARVDQVAVAAGVSKQGIYSYFAGKEGLFLAVIERYVDAPVAALPIDPLDLPAYAGRLFDLLDGDHDIARLITWCELESRHEPGMPLEALGLDRNAQRIRDARARPEAPCGIDAHLLHALLLLCVAWCGGPRASSASVEAGSRRGRRAATMEAARALVASA